MSNNSYAFKIIGEGPTTHGHDAMSIVAFACATPRTMEWMAWHEKSTDENGHTPMSEILSRTDIECGGDIPNSMETVASWIKMIQYAQR